MIVLAVAGLMIPGTAFSQNKQLFDAGWTFVRDGKELSVDLPHDWDIYAAPDPLTGATGTGGGWYPGGKGEYRKTFRTPGAEIVKLHFEGVYQKAEVFVNGQKAGQHAYGYTPFTVDITPCLYKNRKQENEVVVRVDNSAQPNCRWYSGSGIYRHVWLLTQPELHIVENGVFVTTSEVTERSAKVSVAVAVVNESDRRRDFTISVDGRSGNLTLAPGETTEYCAEFTVDQPRLWSPQSPYCYQAKVTVEEGGRVVDECAASYGIRSISFDAQTGFLLNGKPVLLNGACIHSDDGLLGAMAFDAAEVRKVRLMKEAGFNLIRTSHNPPSRALLDACDALGMMVIDESFDGWRTAKTTYDYSTLIDSCYHEDITAMVKRDRNHPSVIAWSIGNEVMERKDLRVVHTAKLLCNAIREYDKTRPITEALCSWDSDWEIYDPHFDVLDIGGYNYMIHKHATDHQRNPRRVMWQTESYPRDAFQNWATVAEHPYIIGDIVWTGLDYLGESGIGRYYYSGERAGEHYVDGGQPDWHGAYCGDVDITGWRKPISHYRDILWNGTSSSLYMAVKEPDGYHGQIKETQWSVWPTWESWNWPGWEGKPIEVEIYTKAPQASLYLNGRLIGTKAVGQETGFKAVFTLPYEPGTLKAEAGGKTTELVTAGKPCRLRLTADRQQLEADGQDLAFITVEVVDSEGNVVPEAAVTGNVTVSGQGQLMAAASADMKDREPLTSPRFTTWKGRAMVVVRSGNKKGNIQVDVSSSLPKAQVGIRVTAKKK